MVASLDDEEAIDHDHLEFFISDVSLFADLPQGGKLG